MFELGALVVGLTAVAKKVKCPSYLLPLVAVILGVGLNMYMKMSYAPEVVLAGLAVGLTATGLYAVTKEELLKK